MIFVGLGYILIAIPDLFQQNSEYFGKHFDSFNRSFRTKHFIFKKSGKKHWNIR